MHKISSFCFCFFLFATVFSYEPVQIKKGLEQELTKTNVETLLLEKKIQNKAYKDKRWSFVLLPNEFKSNALINDISPNEYPYLIENLFLYEKTNKNLDLEFEKRKISKIITALSSLEGIYYYSPSRNKNRLLYEKSYVIDSIASKNKIRDPNFLEVNGFSLFGLQKDLTFGENIYQYNYFSEGKNIGFRIVNKTSLTYSFIKIISPEKLNLFFFVEDLGSHFLVYTAMCADLMYIPFLEKKITNSFNARLDALYSWFIKEYEKIN